MKVFSVMGKVAYGALFALVLPALLVQLAQRLETVVRLPALASFPLGVTLAAVGATVMLAGMAALWAYGGGLPMNAFPPPRYVDKGIYRLLPHPIYTGFCVACVGVAVATGSAAGLWIVSPLVMLGCSALVLGYERLDLQARFGSLAPTEIRLAAATDSASISERISAYLLVLIPWCILYEAVVLLGVPPDARPAFFPFELHLPVVDWTEAIYASTYLAVFLAPMAAKNGRALRTFELRGLLAMLIVFPLYLVVPLVAPPRPFAPSSALGSLLAFERAIDSAGAAFPSFHVIWALFAAEAFAGRWPRLRWLFRAWSVAVALSCMTTGMHALADVLGAFAIGALAWRPEATWEALRRLAERLANSWREWRFGEVRVISHAGYAGLSALVGLLVMGTLSGPDHLVALVVTSAAIVVGAALWAQYLEGSSQLLRPYGFYGGLLGAAIGILCAPLSGSSAWLLAGAASTAGPWIQALGRLRCLVQGCCHGREAPEAIGIRYYHPRSRVCRLAGMSERPLHPTQLYSILWNVLVGVAMARLWTLHVPLNLIAGLYLVLSGLGRFVEEAYRGEPQTPIIARLRLYQWVASATVIVGAILMAVTTSAPAPEPHASWPVAVVALIFAIVAGFALGVDFPNSNRRFSRLA